MGLIKLFFIFLRIGAFTFGGGYAMIPLIQAEVVDENKWLTNEEFIDTIAIAQSAPGAVAVNSSVFIGYKLRGILGAIACTLGVVLPSFIIILVVSIYLYKYRNNEVVAQVFHGIRPAVAALIFSAVYKLRKASNTKGRALIIPVLAIAAILLDINPVLVILTGGLGAVAYYKYMESRT